MDQRRYPWGDHFEPALCRMKQSAWPPSFVPVESYPTDVSPYGVRGLAGNVADWVADELPEGRRMAKGGIYAAGPSLCELTQRWTQTHSFRTASIGMRLARSFPQPRSRA